MKAPNLTSKQKDELLTASRVAYQTPLSVDFWQKVEEHLNEYGDKTKPIVEPRKIKHD